VCVYVAAKASRGLTLLLIGTPM